MNWKTIWILLAIKRFFTRKFKSKIRKMNNLRRRRESVASVYRKTTKFLSSNTANLMKKMPNNKKYRLLAKVMEEYEPDIKTVEVENNEDTDEDDLGERDLDYYLGVRSKETYWRDPEGREQIIKDYLLYHCGVSESDYDLHYKKTAPKTSYTVQPKLKQVPFKIHRKRTRKIDKEESWCEKTRLFKLFANKRDSECSSDSYSDVESDDVRVDLENADNDDQYVCDGLDMLSIEGVRIKEVSEGRPCDNCPELCPGFIAHSWRKTCKSCGCDRLAHSVYHEELGSVRERLGLRDARPSPHEVPSLTAKQTELYYASLAERAPTGVGGATGAAAWRAWRPRALASQLPKQDLSLAHCRHIDEEHKKQFEDFVSARNEIALDIGVASQHHGASLECIGCNKSIRNGSITIQAPRIAEDAYFHPACFSCSECDELLVELAYCALDGRLYCVRHYAERLKPRCHACDELLQSCLSVRCIPAPLTPSTVPPFHPPYKDCVKINCENTKKMGIAISAIISYAGVREAIECVHHILSGILPDTEPDFRDLVEYYSRLLQKTANPSSSVEWASQCGQGYLCLAEDADGKLKSAAVKYYDGKPDSTAILFSTKISSFGQDSVDETNPKANGDYRTERYTPTKTKTIISQSSESFSVGQRNRSPTSENISDHRFSEGSFERDDSDEKRDANEKLTWHYRPKSPPTQPALPEIHFESFDEDARGVKVYSEEFLRSLDGIKFRPLQRSDPSGRRRSFKKRHSSSSTSSRESRASREEELKMFTSLEEAEFERMSTDGGFGSTPNLGTRSYSRSRSREASNERRTDSADATPADSAELRPKLTEGPKLGSFEEEKENAKEKVTEDDEEEEVDDFWGNSGD